MGWLGGAMTGAVAWTGVGLALTPLLEYGWHAWIGHRRGTQKNPMFKSRDLHLEHHRTAAEDARPWREIRENLPGLGLGLAVVNAALGPWLGFRRTVPISIGLVSGYVLVTLYHAQMHERGPRTAYERWMWRFHWHHHAADAKVNFGLTNPVFDVVFGTARVPEGEVLVPKKLAPAWLVAAETSVAGMRVR